MVERWCAEEQRGLDQRSISMAPLEPMMRLARELVNSLTLSTESYVEFLDIVTQSYWRFT